MITDDSFYYSEVQFHFTFFSSHAHACTLRYFFSFSWCNIQNFSHKKSKSICIGRFSWCLWNAKEFLLILEVPEMWSISFVYFPGKAIEKITQVKFSKAHGVQVKMKIDCEALRFDEAESQKIWNVNSDRISKLEFLFSEFSSTRGLFALEAWSDEFDVSGNWSIGVVERVINFAVEM